MYKELTLYLILLTFSACSVFKIQNGNITANKGSTNLDDLKNSNLTNSSFYLQKAEVEVVSADEKKSFLVSVKYCKPDSFLISIRSKTGIEAARIFITKDTLLINDRINRKLYFGSGKDLKAKFGYSNRLLPVLFGDFVLNIDNLDSIGKCLDEVFIVNSNHDGFRLKYTIDCNSDRLTRLELSNDLDSKPVVIEYSESIKAGTVCYYSTVHIRNIRGYKYLNVNYKKIEIPYYEYIEFIPGRNYEPVRIR